MQAKKVFYLTMVCSKLEVGVPVWLSHRKENLMKIKGVQRRATTVGSLFDLILVIRID